MSAEDLHSSECPGKSGTREAGSGNGENPDEISRAQKQKPGRPHNEIVPGLIRSLFPLPRSHCKAGYRGPAGLRSPRLTHSPPCVRHDTSPASHRRPPAFIGPRRAMDSCGVGAFSLNYGPQSVRGKSPYAPDPRLSRIVPTTRDPLLSSSHNPALSDNRAAKFLHSEVSTRSRKTSPLVQPRIRFLTRSVTNVPHRSDTTVASCNGVRDSRESLSDLAPRVAHRFVVQQDPLIQAAVTRRPSAHFRRRHRRPRRG